MSWFSPQSDEFLKQLIAAPGPSGFEEAPRKVWVNEVKPLSDALRIDRNGSAIATLNGKSTRTQIAFAGHLDHIGLMVRYISDEGYLYIRPVGGVDIDTLISSRVKILSPKGIVPGVIGKVAPHLQRDDDADKKLKMHEIWVDIGAKTKAEAEEIAPIGTVMSLEGDELLELRNGRLCGRWDNRFAAFVLAEVLRRLHAQRDKLFPTIHMMGTTQEETAGTRHGATTAAWGMQLTAAIAVDVNHAIDIPTVDKRKEGETTLGGGPILQFGVSTNNKLVAHVVDVAKKANIPVQRDTEVGRHGTDADAYPALGQGIPTLSLCTPLRYMHNSIEMGQISDVQACIDLIVEYILSIQTDINYDHD